MIDKIIKVLLAILLFVCLAKLPYGYYELVRFSALAGFTYLCFTNYKKGNILISYLYGALAILFQPLFKIALGRDIWNVVDVIVGIFLIGSLFFEKGQYKR